ncbi:MAG: DUF362 domain-containing protein [Candidatus Altiarchaeia archaeon]
MDTAKVFYRRVSSGAKTEDISRMARDLLERVVSEEKVELEKRIPLKVHFGEKGNTSFIGPENYEGIIDFLKEKKIDTCFIETNVLYVSERTRKKSHIALAKEHGFTRIPVVIADGETGEDYEEVGIEGDHFGKCRIGKAIAGEKQLIVLSHYKGHMLAGFGGAIKQLGMGCAARGGKLDQHANAQPAINPEECKKCMSCVSHCPRNAIEVSPIPRIDKDKCIGCAACIAACPQEVFHVDWMATAPVSFRQKLAEYALAAQKGKRNVYINYALNITKDCDCDGRSFKPITKDIGVFASVDPVAIDAACCDVLNKREGKRFFTGDDIFGHAEKIGLGTTEYELIEI